MAPLIIEIPEKIVAQMRMPPERAKRMILEELVLRLFERKIIASRQAADLLSMGRLEFERFVSENEISIHGDFRELREDVENLESLK
jgi:predicted HTH domain antitoxin